MAPLKIKCGFKKDKIFCIYIWQVWLFLRTIFSLYLWFNINDFFFPFYNTFRTWGGIETSLWTHFTRCFVSQWVQPCCRVCNQQRGEHICNLERKTSNTKRNHTIGCNAAQHVRAAKPIRKTGITGVRIRDVRAQQEQYTNQRCCHELPHCIECP